MRGRASSGHRGARRSTFAVASPHPSKRQVRQAYQCVRCGTLHPPERAGYHASRYVSLSCESRCCWCRLIRFGIRASDRSWSREPLHRRDSPSDRPAGICCRPDGGCVFSSSLQKRRHTMNPGIGQISKSSTAKGNRCWRTACRQARKILSKTRGLPACWRLVFVST